MIYNNIRYNIETWNDWFSGSPALPISNNYSSSISLNQNTHVFFCVFFSISSSITLLSGASSDISLLVEECLFVDCYRAGDGGGIFFQQGSHCVLSKICAHQCNTNSGQCGQFCFIIVKSGSQYKSIAHLVSVCKCTPYENNNRYYSIYFRYGNISLKNVNSSANRCKYFSGVILYDASISYPTQSTFSNNTDDDSQGIGFYCGGHHMSQCNIIRNHQNPTQWGAIYNTLMAQTILSGCIIDMNTGATIIIHVQSGSVTLQNCYLQSNMQTTGNLINKSPLSVSHSLALVHFHSQMCLTLMHNVIDNVNTLSANIKYLIDTNMFSIHIILTLIVIISIQL